jgi:hypothetical protein
MNTHENINISKNNEKYIEPNTKILSLAIL